MGDGDPEAARSYADSLDDPLCRVGLAARQPRFVLFSPNLPEIVNVGDVATPATASASVAVPPTECASAGSGQMTLRLPYVAFSASRYRGTQPFWYHAWVVADSAYGGRVVRVELKFVRNPVIADVLEPTHWSCHKTLLYRSSVKRFARRDTLSLFVARRTDWARPRAEMDR